MNGPDGKGGVELYERGYGKDAAGIAKEAILYGNKHASNIWKAPFSNGIFI